MSTIDLRGKQLSIKGTVGDDVVVQITFTESDGVTAFDISGYTTSMYLTRNNAAVTGGSFALVVSGASSNILTATMTDTQTTALGRSEDHFTLSMTIGGVTRQWLAGTVRLDYPGSHGSATTTAYSVLVGEVSVAVTQVAGTGSGLSDLVDDTTPQLGGNLDLNGNVITGLVIGTNVQAWAAVLDATTASFTTADETKLDAIEALADVTDATNVGAAGAHMSGGTDIPVADGGTGASTAADARTNLGVAIGTNVQAWDADLDDIAAIADAQGDIIVRGAAGWERLAKSATSTDVLTAGASQPAWAAAAGGSSDPLDGNALVAQRTFLGRMI